MQSLEISDNMNNGNSTINQMNVNTIEHEKYEQREYMSALSWMIQENYYTCCFYSGVEE